MVDCCFAAQENEWNKINLINFVGFTSRGEGERAILLQFSFNSIQLCWWNEENEEKNERSEPLFDWWKQSLSSLFDWWVMGGGTANGSAKRREPSQQSIQGLFFLSLSWNANGMKKRNGMWLMDEEIGFVVFFSLWVMGRNAPNAPQREDKQTNKTNWIHSNQSKQSKESVDGASQFKEAN